MEMTLRKLNVIGLVLVVAININCRKDDKGNGTSYEGGFLLDYLTMENAYVQGNYYYENGKGYKIEYKSDFDSVRIVDMGGNKALRFQVNPDSDYRNERAEVRLAEMVPFSEGMKWVSINYYATGPVSGIIFQCHQFPPHNPPIALRISRTGVLYLQIFNDGNIQSDIPIKYEIGTVGINQWHRVIIGFKADPYGNGKVVVYLNQTDSPDVVYEGAVGFSFEQPYFDTIKFGIYRGKGQSAKDVLFVDEVKYGTSLESVL